jgi:hypothetical protein
MLSVPTLWTVFVINFLALGLIWAYVMRSYPSFEAARFWTGSAFVAAAGAAMAMLRVVFPDSLVPLLFAGTALILAICLAAMGIRKFFNQPVSWRDTLLITGLGAAGLCVFTFVHDSVPARMTVFTIAQALPMVRSLKLLLSRHEGRVNPGARLAGIVTIVILAIFAARLLGALTSADGGFSYMHFSPAQSVVILVLVFLSMSLNFGFLLMAMDRLRNEVADLALLDDLTGVGNRRYLLQRLTEECARSEHGGQRYLRPRRRRRLPAAFHPDGPDSPAARRHAGTDRRRRVLHRAAVLDTARRRHDRAPRAGGLPCGRRAMRRQRHSDRGLDRRRAMGPRDGRVSRPPDCGRRPCALRRQEGRP